MKFNEIRKVSNEIKELPEDQWNDSKKLDSSIRVRNFENSKTMKANDRGQNASLTLSANNCFNENSIIQENDIIKIAGNPVTPMLSK